ncbi:hypothetical protein M1349_04285 [Patescibacteria group bacterium]|nr:hypothetical protein [Patescibacteria group bacterium]
MVFTVTAKNCRISDLWYSDFAKYARKTLQLLPNLDRSVIQLDFVIIRHRGRDFYEGSITLHLPIKNLHSDFEGYDVEKEIQEGFERLFSEIRKYKTTHLVSDSEYSRRETIRGLPEFFFFETLIGK